MSLPAPLQLDRVLFPVSGPDAAAFLQNLLTQDVGRLARERVIYAGLLTPQGKVAFDFMVWRADDFYLIDAPAARAGALAQRLALYRLRARVEIGAPDPRRGIWATPAGMDAPDSAPDPRLAALGGRAVRAGVAAPDAEPGAYRALRIALGVPDLQRDMDDCEAFALEALELETEIAVPLLRLLV